MPFDIVGARKSGYSDGEIADYLGQKTGFDVQGARDAGYGDGDILAELSKAWAQKPLTDGVTQSTAGAGRGSTGLADYPSTPPLTTSGVGMRQRRGGTRSEARPFVADAPQGPEPTLSELGDVAIPAASREFVANQAKAAGRAVANFIPDAVLGKGPHWYDAEPNVLEQPSKPENLSPVQMTALDLAAGMSVRPGAEKEVTAQLRARGVPIPGESLGSVSAPEQSLTDKAVASSGRAGGAVQSTSDVMLSAAQMVPQTLKLGSDIAQIVTLGLTKPLSNALQAWSDELGNQQSYAQKRATDRFQLMLKDPNVSQAQLTSFLIQNPEFTVNTALPSFGSMLVGVGGAKVGQKILLDIAKRRGEIGAELAAAGDRGAELGAAISNAAMNAGDTFDQTDGSYWQKLLAAGVAFGGTAAVGHLTEGGVASQLVKEGKRLSANPVANVAAKAVQGAGKEYAQEYGEQWSQDVGQQQAESGKIDPAFIAKDASAAGVQGALMGLTGAGAMGAGIARDSVMAAVDVAAQRSGLSPRAASALRDAVAKMAPDEAVGFVERAIGGLERRGVATKPGGVTAFKDEVAKRVTESVRALQQAQQTASQPAVTTEPASETTPEASASTDQVRISAPETPAAPAEDYTGLATPPRIATPVDEAAHQAASSPLNDRPEPTPAQAEAGNYKKGHLRISGLDIAIENPHGSVRRGVDENGNAWESTLAAHYGYVKGTLAGDGDHSDVFIKPGTPEDYSGPVFVIDQIDPKTGKFDEHKSVIGVDTEAQARALYLANYDQSGPSRIGAITQLPIAAFKSWVQDGVKRKPLGQIKERANGADAAGDGGQQPADAGRGAGADLLPQQRPEIGSQGAEVAAGEGVAGAGAAGPGSAGRNDALTVGQAVTIGGKPWRVSAAGKSTVTLADEQGNKRVVLRGSPTWKEITTASAAPASAAPTTSQGAQHGKEQGRQGPRRQEGLLNPEQAGVPQGEVPAAPASNTKAGGQATKPEGGSAAAAPVAPAPKPKVYKTRDGANKARVEMGNTHKVQKVKGGFILRAKTEKELAAEAGASQRQRSANGLDVTKDSLLTAIAKFGGLDRESARKDLGVHQNYHGMRSGMQYVFRANGGKTAERMLEHLQESGYMPADAGLHELESAIGRELSGDKQYSVQRYSGEGDQELQDRFEAAQDEPLADFTPDDLVEDGYAGASPDVQALTEQLLADAEAAGIDTEALREDVARATEGQSDDAYHAALQAEARRVLGANGEDAARGDAGAAQGSAQDHGEAAGSQGQEQGGAEGLTLSPGASKVLAREEVELPVTNRQQQSHYASHATGRYIVTVQQFERGPAAVVYAVHTSRSGNLVATSVEEVPTEMQESGEFDKLGQAAISLFDRVKRAQESDLLTAQTAEDLRAKADREAAAEDAAKADDRALAARDAAEKRKRDKAEFDARADAERKRRADAAVEGFELGQEPPSSKVNKDEAAGQGDIFAQPAAEAKAEANPDAEQQRAAEQAQRQADEDAKARKAELIELRKRESVLRQLLECLG